MKSYSVLYAEDVPHYATAEIQAASNEEAIAVAKARHTGDLDFGDPDWNNPILQRIVHIQDENAIDIANDISLDRHRLLTNSKVRDAVQYALEVLSAFTPDWHIRNATNLAVERLQAAYVELGGAYA